MALRSAPTQVSVVWLAASQYQFGAINVAPLYATVLSRSLFGAATNPHAIVASTGSILGHPGSPAVQGDPDSACLEGNHGTPVLQLHLGKHTAPFPRTPVYLYLNRDIDRGFAIKAYATNAPQGTRNASGAASSIPDAKTCDSAIEDYERLRKRFETLKTPSSIRPWHSRIQEIAQSAWSLLVTIGLFTFSIPGRLHKLITTSPQEWAATWSRIKETVKHEAHHYWVGAKLLWYELRISSRLALKAVISEKKLTRRERQQLVRTTADVFRLVPMVVIVAIPFLEFALPLLLRIFPNMLPSTFEDKLKKEEELKKRVAAKLELARFLQDTVAEMAKDLKLARTGEVSATAADLYEFVKKVRAGEPVINEDIVKFGKLFNDELTLDSLHRVQLVSMCRYLGITPFGTDMFLRSRLRAHLLKLKQDDYDIREEGVETLTEDELRQACRERGMKAAYGEGARAYMIRQLKDWLDLSLNRGLPSSLLLLSRVFMITAKDPIEQKQERYKSIKDTLSTLPEGVIDDVSLDALAESGVDPATVKKKKLEMLKREEELIREEEADLAAAAAASTPTVVPEDAAATQAAATAAAMAVMKEATASVALDMEGISEEEKAAQLATTKQQRMQKVVNALAVLASSSGVVRERALFMDLIKKEVERINADLPKGSVMTFTAKGLQALHSSESEPAPTGGIPKQLSNRVSSILKRVEKELDAVESQIGDKMHIIDLDNDGLISRSELEQSIRFLKENLSEEDLRNLLERLEVKEADGEGRIPVSELMALAASSEAKPDASQADGSSKEKK